MKNEPLSLPSKLINTEEIIKITPINQGRHYQTLNILELNNSQKYVLKAKSVEQPGSLYDEAARLKWIEGRLPAPRFVDYQVDNGYEHLIMTFVEGCSADQYEPEEGQKSLGYLLGEGLRTVHSIGIEDCCFNDFAPDKLINMVKRNIQERSDEVMEIINRSFPNHTPEQLLDFLEKNKASADQLVFTHGDYGSANIMINHGEITAFIDLGEAGVSDPYYDIYYLVKSLTYYNNRAEEVENFKKGYGIQTLDENKLKFHQIIDTLLL
ncbi:phosphotransferase [Paenibacillus sp. J2TS4]|uniref:phosphotransferase n=1 Tax=Paenibacillus sp. J2TS4 TaxID=2807194 RepID=UPI001B036297|nr:phosphotransferase [Paenibacillus sp. J2TS4]GIP32795.1 aminoglycoside phosphotransferase APH(3') [Paenibacillus sp. J2TS4]